MVIHLRVGFVADNLCFRMLGTSQAMLQYAYNPSMQSLTSEAAVQDATEMVVVLPDFLTQ